MNRIKMDFWLYMNIMHTANNNNPWNMTINMKFIAHKKKGREKTRYIIHILGHRKHISYEFEWNRAKCERFRNSINVYLVDQLLFLPCMCACVCLFSSHSIHYSICMQKSPDRKCWFLFLALRWPPNQIAAFTILK